VNYKDFWTYIVLSFCVNFVSYIITYLFVCFITKSEVLHVSAHS